MVIPIHSVLSSASSMRLTAPGSPSLIDTGPDALLEARFSTVIYPPNSPSGSSCWPTTYMVEVSTSALLAPPGVRMRLIGAVFELAQGAVLHGRNPLWSPVRKIMGA